MYTLWIHRNLAVPIIYLDALVDGSGMSLFDLNPRPTHGVKSSVLTTINTSNGPGWHLEVFVLVLSD
ncbi:MAG: hypothetical protein CMQ27_04245 [Gammaproteobacteria bacterium]|nr:hypothetical protein [Gammaproteobacteria bacterium]